MPGRILHEGGTWQSVPFSHHMIELVNPSRTYPFGVVIKASSAPEDRMSRRMAMHCARSGPL